MSNEIYFAIFDAFGVCNLGRNRKIRFVVELCEVSLVPMCSLSFKY